MNRNEDSLMEQDIVGNLRYQWTVQTTKLLIEEVRDHISLLNKKNYMQKKIWREIANNFNKRGYNVTDEQCSVKWKNLKRKYKTVRDINNQTGQAKESWEYFDIIDSFLNNTPEIVPVSIASSTHGFRIRQSNSETEMEEHNNENDSAIANASYDTRRNIRRRKRDTENKWMRKLYKQKKQHHRRNKEMQTKFLALFEEYIKIQKDNVH